MSMILFWIGSVFFVFWFCLGFVLVCFFVLVLFFVSFVWLFFSFVSVPDLVSVAIIFLFVFLLFFCCFFSFLPVRAACTGGASHAGRGPNSFHYTVVQK